jgi:hypothetical protein
VIGTGDAVGGLVGFNDGTISDSYATGAVSGNNRVGGLVGHIYFSEVSSSHATGAVSGQYQVGGLVGDTMRSLVSTSFATGTVSGTGGDVGGLVGGNQGTIRLSHAEGAVTGNGDAYGGLVGGNYIYGSISTSFATGNVDVTGDEIGGLVGRNQNEDISYCYASGTVSGREWVGGLVGYNFAGSIEYSYASSSVSGKAYVGGFLGLETGSGTITSCFYNETLKAIGGYYWDSSASGAAVGLTPAAFTTSDFFTTYAPDWDTLIWANADSGINNSFPYLTENSGS